MQNPLFIALEEAERRNKEIATLQQEEAKMKEALIERVVDWARTHRTLNEVPWHLDALSAAAGELVILRYLLEDLKKS